MRRRRYGLGSEHKGEKRDFGRDGKYKGTKIRDKKQLKA
jgi:hypothetical protein